MMWTTSFLLANIPRLFTVGNHEEIIGNTKTLDWCLIPVGTVLFVPIIFEVQCPWNRLSIANILVIQANCTTSTPFHQESTKKPPRIICSVLVQTLGWSNMQKGQKSPLPGHFPIHFDILVWKMQKNLKKIVVYTLPKSNLCLLLPLCSNQLTNTPLWPKSPSKCCPMNF